MATRDALQIREELAVNRLTDAASSLAKAAKIDAPDFYPVAASHRNQKIAELERVEAVADFLESLTVSTSPGKTARKKKT
jgi:hypothetical protein